MFRSESLRLSAYLCVLCVETAPLTQRTQRYAEDRGEKTLRTPESTVERGLANWVAFAWSGFTGCAAIAADPGIAVLIAIDITARAGGELRPATLEGPIGWWRSRLRHTRSKEKNKENYGNG